MNRVYCILKLILLLHPPTSSADTIHPPPLPSNIKSRNQGSIEIKSCLGI